MAAPIDCEAICERFKIKSIRDHQLNAIEAISQQKDVFVGTKTGSGKSLIYESFPVLNTGKCVLVVAPLVTIMTEQCKRLSGLGFKARSVSDLKPDEISQCDFDFLFGSPEVLLGDSGWRETLKSDVYREKIKLIVVDEAHTVLQWGEASGKEEAFRQDFSRLGELRALCRNASMLALTATAGPTQRKKIMKRLCFKANSCIVSETPDRSNIKITSICIPNTKRVEETFEFLFEELSTKREECPRYVIFCEKIATVTEVYWAFLAKFGRGCTLFNMYHSQTNSKVQDRIREDMSVVEGKIRVLICSNAAGMGVNFLGLNNIIHYGLPRELDTFVQQMGRAGRDGSSGNELMMFKPHKTHLKKVEEDLVKIAKDSKECRRKSLCLSYGVKVSEIEPKHACCDICESLCKCEKSECPAKHQAVVFSQSKQEATDNDYEDETMSRSVSDEDRIILRQRLVSLRFSLSEVTLVSPELIHGLTEQVIEDIVKNCEVLFNADDIMAKFPIWSYNIAEKITNIVIDVFGEQEMYDMNIECSESDSSDDN